MTTARKATKKNKTARKHKAAALQKASNHNAVEFKEIRRIFSEHIPARDRTRFYEADLNAMTSTFWDVARLRKKGDIALRVFNPDLKKDGYISKHTVIMVANDDMPFLVDSTMGALACMGLNVHLIVHPIVNVTRDEKNALTGFARQKTGAVTESWMYIEIDETPDGKKIDAIAKNLKAVLNNVRLAVRDWQAMRSKILETITELPRNEVVGLPAGAREETANFLAWLENDQFTFLGMRDYKVIGSGAKARFEANEDSHLGILAGPITTVLFANMAEYEAMSMQQFIARKDIIFITKTHAHAMVHRAVPMDAILIKRYDAKGACVGERLFVGLFTSASYSQPPEAIPLIREKIHTVMHKANLDPHSHDGKALTDILHSLPRDELFQISDEELYTTAIGILQLQERQRFAMFVRHDAFARFVNCLILLPREFFNTKVKKDFYAILSRAFDGHVWDYQIKIGTSALAQLLIVIRTTHGTIPAYNKAELERHMEAATRGWEGRLTDNLVAAFGEHKGLTISQTLAFPDAYRDSVAPEEALQDIAFVKDVLSQKNLAVNLYQPAGKTEGTLHLKWFSLDQPLSLSRILPLMRDMGLEPDAMKGPFEVKLLGASHSVWVHDCEARLKSAAPILLQDIKNKFEECLLKVWHGAVEGDGFNQLVLLAGLSWREIMILRAVGKYIRQARLPYSEHLIIKTLGKHPAAAGLLAKLFIMRHDPSEKDRAKKCAGLERQIADYLRGVTLLEQDRILRSMLNVIQNTLRTNYFQRDASGSPKPYFSFKLDSKKIDGLPLPRPHVEIYVYSPRAEGIHLRGGKVARGGIRWSDRHEDFRTEILSLMKAQQVKNTVIVPVGSKGGFIVKNPKPADMAQEGIECYRILIRGMLDLTDNLVGDKIAPPKNTVRHDGDDPYLVVAADKGTAKFSDIANALSLEYGFWLGDAFASGGSAGYDHKDMGITAKGAWEAVKRHFREMGKNIQKEPFTVVGVGDMSGDVFGNGMLLSPCIRLVAAFNHKHIFIDPTPDEKASLKERHRLFEKPGSQWSDYDKKLISKGGGVFNRDAKAIKLSKDIQTLFGLDDADITPDALIQTLLKAEVDLLWFGGIGTYIKAEDESHADAGDRANDNLRVNAQDVRAKVIGEGANLGMTQKGRVAYARRGGRLNTDAIDNSAGVDTSDHEVNIKVLLAPVVKAGKLETSARNTLLAKMTDEVGALVLRDNYLQTQALSLTQARAVELLPLHARIIQNLERGKRLNRKVEFLPSDDEIAERLRLGQGLTRPELAVLMAYVKITLYDELLASNLPDNPGLEGDLFHYFPKALQKNYAGAIRQHRLRREIIATNTTNSVVNRGGLHFITLMREKTGCDAAQAAGAYAVMRDIFGLRNLWEEIEKLDGIIGADVQTELLLRLSKVAERSTPWYIQFADLHDTADLVHKHMHGLQVIRTWMEKHTALLSRDEDKMRFNDYKKQGVPEKLIRHVLSLPILGHVPVIVTLAQETGQSLEKTADIYFMIETRLKLFLLRTTARNLESDSPWQREAASMVVDDLYRLQAILTRHLLVAYRNKKVGVVDFDSWATSENVNLHSYDTLLTEIAAAKHVELAMLNLALRQLQMWAMEK